MALQLMCAKGCGVAINVSDEQLTEAKELGAPLNIAHEVCPRDAVVKPTYRVQITVTKIDADGVETELAKNGGTVEHATFEEAFQPLSKVLSEQWATVRQWAGVVEQELGGQTNTQRDQ